MYLMNNMTYMYLNYIAGYIPENHNLDYSKVPVYYIYMCLMNTVGYMN